MNPAITNLAVSLGAMQSKYFMRLPRPSTPPRHAGDARHKLLDGRPINFALAHNALPTATPSSV